MGQCIAAAAAAAAAAVAAAGCEINNNPADGPDGQSSEVGGVLGDSGWGTTEERGWKEEGRREGGK